MPVGATVVPGRPGTVGGRPVPGSVSIGAGEDGDWPTTVAIVASAGESAPEESADPSTFTVSVTWSPGRAVVWIWSVTSSSTAWKAGREPTAQVAPRALGHRANLACRTAWPLAETVALTFFASTVLHTQTE